MERFVTEPVGGSPPGLASTPREVTASALAQSRSCRCCAAIFETLDEHRHRPSRKAERRRVELGSGARSGKAARRWLGPALRSVKVLEGAGVWCPRSPGCARSVTRYPASHGFLSYCRSWSRQSCSASRSPLYAGLLVATRRALALLGRRKIRDAVTLLIAGISLLDATFAANAAAGASLSARSPPSASPACSSASSRARSLSRGTRCWPVGHAGEGGRGYTGSAA